MSIKLNVVQHFTKLNDIVLTPLFSNWQWKEKNNLGAPNIIFMRNSPQSTVNFYQIKPKQSYQVWINEGYSELKIKHEKLIPSNLDINFYTPIEFDTGIPYNSDSGNNWLDYNFSLSPKLSSPLGLNTIVVRFYIEGIKEGQKIILSSFDFPINLHVMDEGYFYSPLNFTFLKSSNISSSQALIVGGDNWNLNIPNGLKITSNTATITQLPNGGYFSSGSGNTHFELNLDNNISTILGSNNKIQLPIVINYQNIDYTLPITIIQTGDIYPTDLSFFIASGLVNFSYQDIIINKPGAVSFSYPSFLDVAFLENDNSRILRVSVLDSDNLGSGVFSDSISLTVNNSSFSIPVNVSVSNAFDIGIENETINFSKSMNDLTFYSNNENSYVELHLTTSVFSKEFIYRIPYIDGKTYKNIGLVLDRLIDYSKNTDLELNTEIPTFSLEILEKKSNFIILEFSKKQIPFLKGFKPEISNKKGILQHNKQSRFNPNSFALISFFSLTGIYNYKIRKNGNNIFHSENIFGYLNTIKLDFKKFNCIPGDLIEFVLIDNNKEITKSFVIFPYSETSFELVYEDSFGLKSVINFTGNTVKFLREINNLYESYQNKSSLHQRKLKISDEKILTLNTGFILESQILEVDELLDSKYALLYVNGEKVLNLVPKLEKILNRDSEEFLINYSIDFYINTETYAQDYRF